MSTTTSPLLDGRTRRVAVTLDRAALNGWLSQWIQTASAFLNLTGEQQDELARKVYEGDLRVDPNHTQVQRVDFWINKVFPDGVK